MVNQSRLRKVSNPKSRKQNRNINKINTNNTSTISKHKNKVNKVNVNLGKIGGGLFDFFKSFNPDSAVNDYGTVMGSVINAEHLLIESYEEYARSIKKYFTAYKDYIDNLKKLEKFKNIEGLVDKFENLVIPNDFKNRYSIDRSNPLLISNYLVTDDTLPKNFKKEYVTNQIRYAITQFQPTDRVLIDSVGNISIDGMSCLFTIKTSTGEKFDLVTSISEDYTIDMKDVEEQVKEIISKVKGKIDFDIELIDDFKVEPEELEVPGLVYDDPDDLLEQKLHEIRGSIKPTKEDSMIQNNNSLQSNKPKVTTKPKRTIFDIYGKADKEEEERRKREEEERRKREALETERLRDIGMDALLNPNEFKAEELPGVKEQLKNIFNPMAQQNEIGQGQSLGLEQGLGQGLGQGIGQGIGQGQDPYRIQFQTQYPNIRTFDKGQQPKFLQPIQLPRIQQMGNHQPQQIVDAIESRCRTMSDKPSQCASDPDCFFQANLEPHKRCHKDLKKFNM